ncbi:uncharacterized protein LOC102807264, partial [Saccoglossus kowalevskii]|uniref:Uncharacterized protein LOC102807264 n=2 Tax=Saccoglossus kowalevskii TaxID=10224 RepID=A0ABM0MAH5_SACKO
TLLQRDGYKSPIDLLIVDEISDNLDNNVTGDLRNIPHLRNLPLAHPITSDTTLTIDVLIGADRYWDYVGNHIIRGTSPVAVSSAFGYLFSGPVYSTKRRGHNTNTFHISSIKTPDPELDKLVANYWDLETVGIHDTIKVSETKATHDEQHRQFVDNCLSSKDGRYIAKLPWRPDHDILPTNLQSATSRTRNMINKLPSELVKVYDTIIQDQLKQGFIEEVTDDDREIGHYLPHRSVSKDSESTPIRIVYDCSATSKRDQPSLNQCLVTGPPLHNSLTSILIRFRSNPIAMTADIEKAFLQIQLDESDRKFTKFLWLSDPTDIASPFKTYQFKAILFGATSSPFTLNAALRHLTDSYSDNPTAINLQKNLYVDDVVTGCDTPMQALQFYEQSTEMLATHVSERAYGASVYLVSEHESTLVIAKTRVTPIGKQALTLPRLELMGALIGTRLGQFVSESLKDNFNITKRLLWSDNQITLHWLNGRGRQDVFTKNRVLEITSHHQEYRYVPTSQNPADLLTRGISPRQLSESRVWWFGPDWLTNSALWPKCELFPIEITESVNEQLDPATAPKCLTETAIHHMSTVTKPTLLQTEFGDILPATNMRDTPVNTDNFPRQVGFSIDSIFQVNNYRDLSHLLRITALVLRFVHNIKAKLTRRPLNISSLNGNAPTASEINDAEHRWLKAVQHIHYSDEILYLQRQAKQVGPLCNQLKLFLDDDGILRAEADSRTHPFPMI